MPVRGQVVYLPILERVGPVLFCMMPHCVLPCNRQPRAAGAAKAAGAAGTGLYRFNDDPLELVDGADHVISGEGANDRIGFAAVQDSAG